MPDEKVDVVEIKNWRRPPEKGMDDYLKTRGLDYLPQGPGGKSSEDKPEPEKESPAKEAINRLVKKSKSQKGEEK